MKLSEVDKDLVGKLQNKQGPVSMGGDPEFFITDSRRKILNADAFFPSKHDPIVVSARLDGKSKIFFDGIQAEMAVAHSTCREWLADNIRFCWREVLKRIPKGHKIVLKPSAKIQKSVIDGADPEARIFGCAPDFNAYTLSTNTSAMDASRHPYRYAGGHLHIGLPDLDYRRTLKNDPWLKLATSPSTHLRVIKLFDLLVTIPTLALDSGPGSRRRRAKYGRAGCFRPTPYGVEYRTPSCWWLKSPSTVSLVYGLAKLAWTIVGLDLDAEFAKAVKADEQEIMGCINESDLSTSRKIWSNLRPYVALIGHGYNNPLNIKSVQTDKRDYVRESYRGFNGPPKIAGKPVYCLAAFEYLLKNGTKDLIDENLEIEWGVDRPAGISYNGFMNESFAKFINNKDFHEFQTDFLNNFFK